jgi:hypothetical protein
MAADQQLHPLVQLEKFLLEPGSLEIIGALAEALGVAEQDELATSLCVIFGHNEADMTLLKFALSHEIQNTAEGQESTLFRGATLASKLSSVYARNWGLVYLFHLLDPTIEEVCCDLSLEVDPSRLKADEDLERNRNRLMKTTTKLLMEIRDSVDECPTSLRLICEYLQVETVKRFPAMKYKVLGGFFFLRFVCPALTTPEAFDFRSIDPTNQKARRALIMISKVLQNLASDTKFGDKEPYMAFMNPFLDDNRRMMHEFYDDLVKLPNDLEDAIPPNDLLTEEFVFASLRSLRKQIVSGATKTVELLTKRGKYDATRKALMTRLNEIVNATLKDGDDAAVAASHRSLLRNNLQKDIAQHSKEIEAARNDRRLMRRQSNADYMREVQARKAASETNNPASPFGVFQAAGPASVNPRRSPLTSSGAALLPTPPSPKDTPKNPLLPGSAETDKSPRPPSTPPSPRPGNDKKDKEKSEKEKADKEKKEKKAARVQNRQSRHDIAKFISALGNIGKEK